MGRPQPHVSQQLGWLREAVLVAGRRKGLFVCYRLNDSRVERVLEAMLESPEEHGPVRTYSCPRCEASSEQDDGSRPMER